MDTAYTLENLIENEVGWLFYDAALKCWKSIFGWLDGQRILDVGCGTGTAIALIKVFNPLAHVEGFEGSDAGRKLWEQRHLRVKSGDIHNLPYEDGSFDTVFTSHVLEHCERPEAIVRETLRVAARRVIHVVPDGDVQTKNFGTPHLHVYDRRNFKQLMLDAPCELVHYASVPDLHINSLIAVCDVR